MLLLEPLVSLFRPILASHHCVEKYCRRHSKGCLRSKSHLTCKAVCTPLHVRTLTGSTANRGHSSVFKCSGESLLERTQTRCRRTFGSAVTIGSS